MAGYIRRIVFLYKMVSEGVSI